MEFLAVKEQVISLEVWIGDLEKPRETEVINETFRDLFEWSHSCGDRTSAVRVLELEGIWLRRLEVSL